MTELVLERREQQDDTMNIGPLSLTPAVSGDYWSYRVRLTEKQAVLGFPKFYTVGIGFAVEDDWNTNLPHSCNVHQILDHIWHNAGDPSIKRDDVLDAIAMIQNAVAEDWEPMVLQALADGKTITWESGAWRLPSGSDVTRVVSRLQRDGKVRALLTAEP